jgi:hypothetical protein
MRHITGADAVKIVQKFFPEADDKNFGLIPDGLASGTRVRSETSETPCGASRGPLTQESLHAAFAECRVKTSTTNLSAAAAREY